MIILQSELQRLLKVISNVINSLNEFNKNSGLNRFTIKRVAGTQKFIKRMIASGEVNNNLPELKRRLIRLNHVLFGWQEHPSIMRRIQFAIIAANPINPDLKTFFTDHAFEEVYEYFNDFAFAVDVYGIQHQFFMRKLANIPSDFKFNKDSE